MYSVALFAVLFAGLSCAEDPSEGARNQPPTESLNVVLALVDTLRADHLGTYGYERNTSPQIDRFAAGSLVFTNARSQSPCTFPSVNSLLTSRDPAEFLGREVGDIGIPESARSLAEAFADSGYRTAAVSTSAIVRKSPSPHNRVGGFGRGFELFDESCFRRPAGCVNKRAFEHLDAAPDQERPFFLYLHYLDPHGPYQPPATFKRRFATGYEGKDYIAKGNPNPIAETLYGKSEAPLAVDPKDLAHLVDLYDEEIAYFDSQFRVLLEGLRERGLSDKTVVVLVSDHGEDFLEHDDIKHCRSLHETQIRTPLILSIPGVPGGARIDIAVGNIDLVPTLLDYAGIRDAGIDYEGRSLRPEIEGAGVAASMSFSSWRSSRSVVSGAHKFVLDRRAGTGQLFDIRADPLERSDLLDKQPAVAARLRQAVESRLERSEADRRRSIELGDRAADQLKALGYLE